MPKYAYAFMLLALMGCDSRTPEMVALEKRQELINKCQSYGFEYNSPEFKNCLMQLDIARELKPVEPMPQPVHCNSYGNGLGHTSTTCY